MDQDKHQLFSEWLKSLKFKDSITLITPPAEVNRAVTKGKITTLVPAKQNYLKDYFIPHAGNNYKPDSLHPKRLALYATAAVLVKLIIVGVVLVAPIRSWLAPAMLESESKAIIDLTNRARQEKGLNALTESKKLDLAAAAKADDMVLGSYFAHVSPAGKALDYWMKAAKYNFIMAGENLAMGYVTADEVVDAWRKSPTHYANIIDPDFTQIGVAIASGKLEEGETTLVAQMFGRPSTEAVVPPAKAKQPAASLIVKDTLAAKPEVLAEKSIATTQVEPQIISPETGMLTNAEKINLTVSHGAVDRLDIVDNQQVIATYDNLIPGTDDFEIDLPEGVHNLSINASLGNALVQSNEISLTVDLIAPTADREQSRLSLAKQPDGNRIFQVSVNLSQDTESAKVLFANQIISLAKSADQLNQWQGRAMIYGENDIQPLTMATVVARDRAGNQAKIDLDFQNVSPVKVSRFAQYLYIKNHAPGSFKILFDISTGYYQILLLLVALSLAVNIVVEIRRQHHQLITSGLGLILLLCLLLVF